MQISIFVILGSHVVCRLDAKISATRAKDLDVHRKRYIKSDLYHPDRYYFLYINRSYSLPYTAQSRVMDMCTCINIHPINISGLKKMNKIMYLIYSVFIMIIYIHLLIYFNRQMETARLQSPIKLVRSV
jgi:hypothetical protein